MGMTEGGRYERYELPDRITGHRNVELTKYAGQVWTKTSDPSELENALQKANSERCVPPLSEKEVHGIVKSISTNYKPGLSPEYEAMRSERRDVMGEEVAYNDKELSRLFGSLYRDRMRYVPEADTWFAYDGTKWIDGGAGGVQRAEIIMKEFSDHLCRAASRVEDEDKRKKAMAGAARYCCRAARKRLLDDVESELSTSIGEFDRDPLLLNCRNCTIDLRTMNARRHDPRDLITKCTGCDYDDTAGYAEWLAFLADTFRGDLSLSWYLQKSIGAAIAADSTDERFSIAFGPTRTGKSTTLDTILSMFGDYGATVQPETLQEVKRNSRAASGDIARLDGKRFVECAEPPKNMMLDVSLIKQLTGGDVITARKLFRDEFQFHPRFQLWINTNYLPEVTDQTLFESGRAVVVPFNNRRPENERDTGLKERMKAPDYLSSVLNWALDGYRAKRAFGLTVPVACRAATAEYSTDSDRIGAFIADRCDMGECCAASGAELYKAYSEWTQREGCGKLSSRKFYAELKRKDGITFSKRETIAGTSHRNVFHGIRVARGTGL